MKENFWFSDVFRGGQKGRLRRKGLEDMFNIGNVFFRNILIEIDLLVF